MAIHTYCDDPSHEAFTPAVAKVRVRSKEGNTIHTEKAWDSCVEHIGIFVLLGWDLAVAPNFYEVTVDKIDGA